MNEQRIIDIIFKEEGHEYTVNGRKSDISVTGLIGKHIDKTEWHTIPEDILTAAANRGTAVHLDLELMVKDGREPESQEAKNFALWLAQQKLENPMTEFKLAIEHKGCLITGTADLIATLNGKSIVADYKTTSVIHKESVRWQMSLLDYMARKCNGAIINGVPFVYTPADEMYVFHFNKQAVFTPVLADKISDAEIERLLDAEAYEKEYTPLTFITPRLQSDVTALQEQITKHKQALKALEDQDKALRASLLEAFEAYPDIKSVECPEFKVTYVSPTAKEVFDAKTFEVDHPEEAAKYRKLSTTKGYVKITMRDIISAKDDITSIDSGLPVLPKQGTKREKAKKDYFM